MTQAQPQAGRSVVAEAAGVEPDYPRSTNRLMEHDFRRKILIPRRFPPSIESPGIPLRPLESTPVLETFWRRDRTERRRSVARRAATSKHFCSPSNASADRISSSSIPEQRLRAIPRLVDGWGCVGHSVSGAERCSCAIFQPSAVFT